MKNFTLIFTLFYCTAHAQWIGTPTIIPQSPTPADSVQVIIQTMTPYLGQKLQRSASVNKTGAVIINICNYSGMPAAIQYYTDTFQLGQLPGGTYSMQINYSISGSSSSCAVMSETTSAHQFTVAAVTGLRNQYRSDLTVYPNPAADVLFIGSARTDIGMFDLTGRLVMTIPRNTQQVNVKHLPEGVYFLRENYNNAQPLKFVIQR